MKLVYLSPVPFHSFSQRPQKFLDWCFEGIFDHALWVEPYPTRLPTFIDFLRRPSKKYIKYKNKDRISLISLTALPIEPIYILRWLNILFWVIPLFLIKNYCNKESVILVIAKPSLFGFILCKLIKFEKVIYDAMDDFPSFYTGISKISMMKFESRTISDSNIIIASSTAIFDKIKKMGGFVLFIPNGMDVNLLPKHLPKKNNCKKVYGYVGTIGPWFDWEFIKNIAKMRPNSQIRIIGPVHIDIKDHPDNVKFIPECSHEDAITEMSKLDVALIPFLRTNLTKSVDPIKYYEYKSLGLPIISTPFGEMCFRVGEKGVYICESTSDIALAIDQADQWECEDDELSKFIVENSWSARFNLLSEYIKK
jgi:glycosyltransferase involved in cell wall biosynthesis